MRSGRVILVVAALVAGFAFAASPADAKPRTAPTTTGADCTLPESDADALATLNYYYPNRYVWDDTHLTVAVQATSQSAAHVAAVEAAIAGWNDVLQQRFDGQITLTDVTGTRWFPTCSWRPDRADSPRHIRADRRGSGRRFCCIPEDANVLPNGYGDSRVKLTSRHGALLYPSSDISPTYSVSPGVSIAEAVSTPSLRPGQSVAGPAFAITVTIARTRPLVRLVTYSPPENLPSVGSG